MERALSLIRSHPASFGFTIAIAVGVMVGAFAALLMTRAGLSLRPLVFLAGFFGIIVTPQWIYHVLREQGLAPVLVWTPSVPSANRVENSGAFEHGDAKFLFPEKVFGPGFDPSLLADVRRLFPQFQPAVAQMAVFPGAETTIAARFNDPAQAQLALRTYAAMLGISALPTPGSDGSYQIARAADHARLAAVGRTLFVWTGANNEALDRRQAASSGTWSAGSSETAAATDPRIRQWLGIMAVALPLLVIGASLWFFKMSSWAATVPPVTRPWPAQSSELRDKLRSLTSLHKGTIITAGEQRDEIVVTWQDDAAWIDHANAHRQTRAHKLVLRLDEAAKVVRVTEYTRRSNSSVGANGLSMNWQAQRGIVFFQVDYQRVAGLQLRSAPTSAEPASLSHGYRFNLQELKAPVIRAVVESGWAWKPVIWNGPAWLRWATE